MASTTSLPSDSANGNSDRTSWPAALARRAPLVRWLALALIAVSLLLLFRALPTDRVLGLVQGGINRLGIWGSVALGLIYVVAALLFVPGSILTLAAGAVYGLWRGTLIVSLASTTAAALAFLIARHLARDRVRRKIERSRKLAAVDEAIGEQGWKVVALLRLSPAVPFNLQNYLYGVTAVRFWPCVLASWVAMLPGTFLYVYLGSLGRAAAGGEGTSAWEWGLRGVGLLATLAVTVYITWIARKAIRERTAIEGEQPGEAADTDQPAHEIRQPNGGARSLWGTLALAVFAVALLGFAAWASLQQDVVRGWTESLLGLPPSVESTEVYEEKSDGPTFDHSTFDALLQKHVAPGGWVDYEGLRDDEEQLDRYLTQLAHAPFETLGRDEKLALLINAYNAFTLRLILDHYPLESIQNIPASRRWDAERWQIGRHTWSLNQIEHEQIRPKFREPRIHFALVCAAVGCPPLRSEAYTGTRIDEQLADQTAYVHQHPRWLRFDAGENVAYLTELYKWYGSDFEQYAPSVLDYAARFAPDLRQAMESGDRPKVRWIDDWALNDLKNKP